jgi:RNA polymerase sigma factor (TIGR02999 family)
VAEFAQTIYRQLHAIARRRLAGREFGHTLQPTALVSEAWLKLRDHFDMAEPSPAFFKTAAEAMRQVLIDHARRKKRLKRGGEIKRDGIEIGEVADVTGAAGEDFDQVIALNDAVTRLESLDSQTAEVVKLRFYAGLTVEQTAEALGIGERTVKREWSFARAWLAKELSSPE